MKAVQHLHSIMYLLIRLFSLLLTQSYLYLHSIMYLLIHNSIYIAIDFMFNLHSIMYLLIQRYFPPNACEMLYLHSIMYLLIPVLQLPLYHLQSFFFFCRPLSILLILYPYFYYNFALSLYLSHCRPSYIFTSLLVDNFYYLYIDKNLINRLHFTFHQDCSFIIASISAFYNINLTGIIFFFLY